MGGEPETWASEPPFAALIGLRVIEATGGAALSELTWRPELTNRKGDLLGGLLSTVMDLTASRAIRSREAGLRGVSTVTMTVQFLKPAAGDIRCRAQATHVTGRLAWAEAQIFLTGDDAAPVATATCVFRLIRDRT